MNIVRKLIVLGIGATLISGCATNGKNSGLMDSVVNSVKDAGQFMTEAMPTTNNEQQSQRQGSPKVTSKKQAPSTAEAYCYSSEGQTQEQKFIDNVLFGVKGKDGLLNRRWRQYLVDFCLPKGIEKRFEVTEFLFKEGAMHALYAEKNLQDLVGYLEDAGIDLDLKQDAIENDKTLLSVLKSDTDSMKKASAIFHREQTVAEKISKIARSFSKLKKSHQKQARQIAGVTREHAFKSTFYLTRAIYVTKRLAIDLKNKGKETIRETRAQTGWFDKLTNVLKDTNIWTETERLVGFVEKDTDAIVTSADNTYTLYLSFDNNIRHIPQVSQKTLEQDVNRLNSSWGVPDDNTGEAVYLSVNTK